MQLAGELGIEVIEKRITRDEVYCADEAFFTGTAAEVTPIRELDNRQIGVGHRGPITKALQEKYLTSSMAAPLPTPTGWPSSKPGRIHVRQQDVEVTAHDLPLHCPTPNAPLWSQHPRVFLDVLKTGEVTCPYCSPSTCSRAKPPRVIIKHGGGSAIGACKPAVFA
jgi:uncharacterized Zn-finger protein